MHYNLTNVSIMNRIYVSLSLNHILPFLLLILILTGCISSRKDNLRMNRAERLMESAPDSAMAILDSISLSSLSSRQEKARYALLKSMALDKNFIDTITFDVLQPAIDRYLEKGTPDEKLRTLYYQGRIFENRNEVENAMKCYFKATELRDFITDSIVLARAYTSKGYIYYNQNKFLSSVSEYLAGAAIYEAIKRDDLRADNLVQALDIYTNIQDRHHADSILAILGTLPDSLYSATAMTLHCKIIYARNFLSPKDITALLDTIDNERLNDGILLDMALAYVRAGDKKKALECFRAVSDAYNKNRVKYLSIKSDVLEANGYYVEALSSLRAGIAASDSVLRSWQSDDRLTVENKYELEKTLSEEKNRTEGKEREVWWAVVVILILIILSMGLYLFLRETKIKVLKTEKENFTHRLNSTILDKKNTRISKRYNDLKKDYDSLSQMLHSARAAHCDMMEYTEGMRDELVKTRETVENIRSECRALSSLLTEKNQRIDELKKRIDGLRKILIRETHIVNGLLASHIASNAKYQVKYDQLVQTTDCDRMSFLKQLRNHYATLYPHFINLLEEKDLSEIEINYVCLYAMGLRGKEIGDYLQTRSHYNITSGIRMKLGLSKNDTNLALFIKNEMEEEE